MTYLLDSNIIIAILKGKGPAAPEWAVGSGQWAVGSGQTG